MKMNKSEISLSGKVAKIAVGAGVAMSAVPTVKADAKSSERPNVLVIIFDQLRYDVFSHRNHEILKTPNIDRLGAEGVIFTEATCTSPVCGPSRAAMLTGCYAYDGKYIKKNREPEDEGPWLKPIKTVDELLKEGGYSVEYRGKWHCGKQHMECYNTRDFIFGHKLHSYNKYLIDKGYERKDEGGAYLPDTYTQWTYRYWPVDKMIGKGPRDLEYDIGHSSQAGILEVKDEDTLTAWTAQKTIDMLDSKPEKPFSVTCSILHPHGPIIPNEKYGSMFKPEDMPLPKNMNAYHHQRLGKKLPIPDKVSHRGVQEFMALYYGLVKECDDHVGRILDALERNGFKDNTLVVLTSDHGEFLGSHNAFGKGEFIEESFRVPLIMRYPKKIEAGLIKDNVATGADIAPTILDYCNVAVPEWMHGRTLRNVINGADDSVQYAYGEIRNEQCLRSKEWKLVINKGEPIMLFDLANDPMEEKNLLRPKSQLTEKATAKMKEMLAVLKKDYKVVQTKNSARSTKAGKKKKKKRK